MAVEWTLRQHAWFSPLRFDGAPVTLSNGPEPGRYVNTYPSAGFQETNPQDPGFSTVMDRVDNELATHGEDYADLITWLRDKLVDVDWQHTLLQQYAPVLKYDSSEQYMAEAVDGIASVGPVPPACLGDYDSLIVEGATYPVAAIGGDPDCHAPNQLSIDSLVAEGQEYPWDKDPSNPVFGHYAASTTDHLDERDSYAADSAAIYSVPGWGNQAYGRVYEGANGDLWLQYSF
jgi:hypothetical protein